MEQKRNFKGIWIPKEVWLSKDLSIQEKVLLVEVDSLDNDEGCFASNKYFSEFFNISIGRVSQIINELSNKNYLNIEYIKKDKQIIKRILKINKPPYPEVFNFLKGGIKYSKGGYLENCKDNNISNNNTNNNNINNNIIIPKVNDCVKTNLEIEFEDVWSNYPRKQGKTNALKYYIRARKKGVTKEEIEKGLMNYLQYIRLERIKSEFIKQGSTWFNQECWNDDYKTDKKPSIRDLDLDINSLEW